MLIKYDFHNHTKASYCAKDTATVASVIGGLEDMGFESAGFCDHLYPDTDCADYLRAMRREISRCTTKMQVFIGTEVEMLAPGVLDAAPERLAGYDYISVACPHYQNKRVAQPLSYDYTAAAQNMLDYFVSAAAIPFVDVIVHPFDARNLKDRQPGFVLAEAMTLLEPKHYMLIIEQLTKNRVAVELTERLRQADYYSAIEPFLLLCRDNGVRLALGSDSHAPEHLGSIRRAADALERLKITEEMLWHPSKNAE